jgi:hypothetical protein
MGFSVYGLLGIRAFGYTGFSVLKPTFLIKIFLMVTVLADFKALPIQSSFFST